MRRRRSRKSNVSMSLFPFLAVLVCTMGALIVLLVLVVQQARVTATVARQAAPAEDDGLLEQFRNAIDDFAWRREILETQRSELTEQLADRRLQLSHLEDHIRRLEDRWKNLEAEAAELREIRQNGRRDQAETDAERARLRERITAARQELEEAREAAAKKPRSFAIIPYEGPNGTQRRPIFIECSAHGIVLQPDGIVLGPQDFDGPLGPGNPLDAALRAVREYLVRHDGLAGASEPYPLLVVRPDGTMAYQMARAAMKSWEDAFGYELIDADMKLEFPPSDPQRKQLVEAAVNDARHRQALLAAAMPNQFPRGGTGGGGGGFMVASRSGGFEPIGGGADRGRSLSGIPGGGGSGNRSRGVRGTGTSGSGEGPAGRDGQEGAPGANTSDRSPSRPRPGQPGEGASSNAANPSATRSSSGPGGASGAAAGGAGSGGASGTGGGTLATGSTGGTGLSGSAAGGGSRGSNWALPESSRSATSITRPIRVVCWPDRLILMPDEGDISSPRTIEVPADLSARIDDFVTAVWEHTDRWGLAVLGGYWKPVLHVEVAPGGAERFAELESELDGSGLEVVKKPW